YKHDPKNPLKEKPKFFFTVNSLRCKEERSALIEVGMEVDIPVCDKMGKCISGLEYTLIGTGGVEAKGKTASDGRIKSDTLPPSDYKINFDWKSCKKPDADAETFDLEGIGEIRKVKLVRKGGKPPIACKAGVDYAIVISQAAGDASH
ncbi:MAG: hypothetical protein FWE20_11865, partial [Defluviitaleaceae bacterium]|nr:hypothetical protein [Defluviitaleaceae bacterium]